MRLALAFLLLCVVGCGPNGVASKEYDSKYGPVSAAPEIAGWDKNSGGEASEKTEGALPEEASGKRKIIYTASMEVVVEQFDGVESKLNELVKKYGGFVASANLGRMSGERRSGSWTIRIPVKNYQEFLSATGDIGVPASRNEKASDVTEEFVDIEARIKNKKRLEARVLELLDRPEDKIQHVIEVEKELARVREEIERMEGRMRYLADKTSLTTITITIREERDYVPEQAPTFTSRIGNAWSASLIQCKRIFEDVVVLLVRNAIGFIVFLLACILLIPVFRRIWRFGKRTWLAANQEVPVE